MRVPPITIHPEMTVEVLINAYPRQVAPVLIKYGLACVGCPLCRFHTLAEIAVIYHLELDSLMKALTNALAAVQKEKSE